MELVCKGSLLFPFFLLVTFLSFSVPEVAHALTVENITFADSTTIGGKPVPLRNAALLRYLKFIKAYLAALYLPEGVKAEDVLADVPKRLEISYLVSIKGLNFDKGADFAASYFGIWLGREPIDEKLKRDLLKGR